VGAHVEQHQRIQCQRVGHIVDDGYPQVPSAQSQPPIVKTFTDRTLKKTGVKEVQNVSLCPLHAQRGAGRDCLNYHVGALYPDYDMS
jgi:hypothetical protein